MIYFIHNNGHIKIGFSADPWGRLASLQTAHYQQLDMLATMPGEQSDEREIHRRFWKHRERGEWFRDNEFLRQFIDEIRGRYPELQEQTETRSVSTREQGQLSPVKFRQMYDVETIGKACSAFDLFVQSGGRAEYRENNKMFWLGLPGVRWVGGNDPTMRYTIDYDSGQATVKIGRESKLRTLTNRINEAMMFVEYFFCPQIFYREDYGIDITFRKVTEAPAAANPNGDNQND